MNRASSVLSRYFEAKLALNYVPFKIPVISLVTIYALCIFCMTGIIFGFPSLRAVLVDHSVYHHLCNDLSDQFPPNVTGDEQIDYQPSEQVCPAQSLRLNTMFITASSTINFLSFFLGMFQDWKGVRWMGALSSIIFGSGCVLFALGLRGVFDGFIIGYNFFAIGGISIYLPSLTLGAKDPARQGFLVSILSCSFDASSVVFWFMAQAYFAFPQALIISLLRLDPEDDELENQTMKLKDEPKKDLENKIPFEDTLLRTEIPLNERTLIRQYLSYEFILTATMLCIFMTAMNFYIGSTTEQLLYISPGENLSDMVSYFSVIMGLFAVLSAPVVGYIIDELGLVVAFFINSSLLTIQQVLLLIPILWIHWIVMVVLTVLRALLFSSTISFLMQTFGFQKFGSVFGMLMMLSGIVNLICIPLTNISINKLGGNFFWMNALLFVFACLSFLYPIWVWREKRISTRAIQ